ncbi:hypothetical protein OF83DRAFT_1084650 [Amylostereum chailletii]|nr:hypothetical protein OF83DRAFT_1084650 [Amylostereum chailletii]
MTPAPPAYSPSTASPSYSTQPRPDEQRLAQTARKKRPTRIGTMARSNDFMTVALKDLEMPATLPTFRRSGVVSGDVEFNSVQGIVSVTAKLEGTLHVGESSSAKYHFFSCSSTVWKADGPSSICPSVLPFECTFPESYKDGEQTRLLPPSYSYSDGNFIAGCEYSLIIRVTRTGKFLWRSPKTLSVKLLYAPKSRPHQPILSCPFPFNSTIKTLPEEWHQVSSSVTPKANSKFKPIECDLFIPAVQIYAIQDTIPFFLQLRAPTTSLQAFFRPTPTGSALRRWRSTGEASKAPTMRVYLKRQVVANTGGHRSVRSHTIGEGVLCPLPPSAVGGVPPLHRPGDGIDSVEYEGELQCTPDVSVGGFSAGKLLVTDFIVLSLVPAQPLSAEFVDLNHSHSVRIVTDSCRDSLER